MHSRHGTRFEKIPNGVMEEVVAVMQAIIDG
jgi:hypothetical protein